MNYEINISLNGTHFFATAERSLTNVRKLREVLEVLLVKFPESEGYHMHVTRQEHVGYHLNITEVLGGK